MVWPLQPKQQIDTDALADGIIERLQARYPHLDFSKPEVKDLTEEELAALAEARAAWNASKRKRTKEYLAPYTAKPEKVAELKARLQARFDRGDHRRNR